MKKTFTNTLSESPAMSFITSAPQGQEPKEPQAQEAKSEEPKPEQGAKDPQAESGSVRIAERVEVEAKTKRLQLLLKPSTYKAIKEKARQDGDSLNNYINRILEAYAK